MLSEKFFLKEKWRRATVGYILRGKETIYGFAFFFYFYVEKERALPTLALSLMQHVIRSDFNP